MLRRKLVVVIAAGSIASLKSAVTLLLVATSVARSAGEVEMTVGPVDAAVVTAAGVEELPEGLEHPARVKPARTKEENKSK
jgi:hypothetical protein